MSKPFHKKTIYPVRLAKSVAILALALLGNNAAANMTVYPMVMSIGGDGKAASQIRVFSKSPETQYVKVSVKKVLAPATEQEREEVVTNWEGEGIVVSPQKFALAAGGSRAVRLVNLSVPESEVLYRVYFEPTSAPQEVQEETPAKAATGDVSVALVWGVLVHALPKVAQPALVLPAPGTNLHNTGNVRIGVREVAHCQADVAQEACQWQTVNRNVYPGQRLALPIAQTPQPLRVKYQVEGKQHDIQIQESLTAMP